MMAARRSPALNLAAPIERIFYIIRHATASEPEVEWPSVVQKGQGITIHNETGESILVAPVSWCLTSAHFLADATVAVAAGWLPFCRGSHVAARQGRAALSV